MLLFRKNPATRLQLQNIKNCLKCCHLVVATALIYWLKKCSSCVVGDWPANSNSCNQINWEELQMILPLNVKLINLHLQTESEPVNLHKESLRVRVVGTAAVKGLVTKESASERERNKQRSRSWWSRDHKLTPAIQNGKVKLLLFYPEGGFKRGQSVHWTRRQNKGQK